MRIGTSIYESNEFKKVVHNFTPLSELGIGILSAFMIATRIEVDSKKLDSEPIELEINDTSDFMIARPSNKKDIGTTIKLYLKQDESQNLKLREAIEYYIRHVDIPISISENGSQFEHFAHGFHPPSSLTSYLRRFGFKLHDLELKSETFDGVLSLCMRYDNSNNCFVPLKRFENSEFKIQWKEFVVISNNGIRVDDNSILAPWFSGSPCYVDINFHTDKLKLDASRSRFIWNNQFKEIQSELENAIIEHFRNYLKDIQEKCKSDFKKIVKITNLFISKFSSLMVLAYHKKEISKSIFDFVKENYFFRCISDGKFTYMTADQIIKKEYLLTYEPLWENGNDNYLQVLSSCTDFNKNVNYVIITQDDDVSLHDYDKGKVAGLVLKLFENENVIPFGDIIKFDRMNDLDGKLEDWWWLVSFPNYRSNHIIEEYHKQRLLNYNHPFVKLIVDNKDLLEDGDNQLYFDVFMQHFGALRGGIPAEEII